jgi:hypothetical protein
MFYSVIRHWNFALKYNVVTDLSLGRYTLKVVAKGITIVSTLQRRQLPDNQVSSSFLGLQLLERR